MGTLEVVVASILVSTMVQDLHDRKGRRERKKGKEGRERERGRRRDREGGERVGGVGMRGEYTI